MRSRDDVERGIMLQRLIREEFSGVDPSYEMRQYDEHGNLVYGPTVSFIRTGPEFRYALYGCGERKPEFEIALHRAFDRFGQGQ
jgi:hypothetical protein